MLSLNVSVCRHVHCKHVLFHEIIWQMIPWVLARITAISWKLVGRKKRLSGPLTAQIKCMRSDLFSQLLLSLCTLEQCVKPSAALRSTGENCADTSARKRVGAVKEHVRSAELPPDTRVFRAPERSQAVSLSSDVFQHRFCRASGRQTLMIKNLLRAHSVVETNG